LQKTSLVIWLGNSEKSKVRRPSFIHLVDDGPGHPLEEVPRSKQTKPEDRQLIDDTISIFDVALDQFDKDNDYQLRRIIDQLAMEVLTSIREYTMARASARPRAMSK
jgi:hypothetical protein